MSLLPLRCSLPSVEAERPSAPRTESGAERFMVTRTKTGPKLIVMGTCVESERVGVASKGSAKPLYVGSIPTRASTSYRKRNNSHWLVSPAHQFFTRCSKSVVEDLVEVFLYKSSSFVANCCPLWG